MMNRAMHPETVETDGQHWFHSRAVDTLLPVYASNESPRSKYVREHRNNCGMSAHWSCRLHITRVILHNKGANTSRSMIGLHLSAKVQMHLELSNQDKAKSTVRSTHRAVQRLMIDGDSECFFVPLSRKWDAVNTLWTLDRLSRPTINQILSKQMVEWLLFERNVWSKYKHVILFGMRECWAAFFVLLKKKSIFFRFPRKKGIVTPLQYWFNRVRKASFQEKISPEFST